MLVTYAMSCIYGIKINKENDELCAINKYIQMDVEQNTPED